MYLDIKCSSWLAPEAPDLLDEPHGCLADQDPHSLTLLLNLPRHQSRLRHHAVVGNFRPGDNSDCWATSIVCWLKEGPHPSYFTCENPFWCSAWRWVCEESETPQTRPGDPEPCWQSLSHGCLLKNRLKNKKFWSISFYHTDIIWHPWHNHEVIRHCEDVVDVELGEPRVQVCVEKVHKLN